MWPPGLGRPVRPLAPPGRVLGQFHPSRTVLPWKKLKKNVHIRGSNPYSGCKQSPGGPSWRVFATTIGVRPHNVNIFNFFYERTVLDGWNGQIGALGAPGIAFGAVLICDKWGCRRKMPRSGRIWSILRNLPKTGMKSLPMGPSSPPSPHGGARHPPGPDQPIWGLEWGGELKNTVHWWGAPWGVFLTRTPRAHLDRFILSTTAVVV